MIRARLPPELVPPTTEDPVHQPTAPTCCPDTYLCPASGDVECPRHGGFTTCCHNPAAHIPTDRAQWHAAHTDYERQLLDDHIRLHRLAQALTHTPHA